MISLEINDFPSTTIPFPFNIHFISSRSNKHYTNTSFNLSKEPPMKETKPLAAVGFTGIKDVASVALCVIVGC